jgi:hypothetical protein
MPSKKKRMFILPKETNRNETVRTKDTRLFINTIQKQLLSSQLYDVVPCIAVLNNINNLGIEITPFGLFCSPKQYRTALIKLQEAVTQN